MEKDSSEKNDSFGMPDFSSLRATAGSARFQTAVFALAAVATVIDDIVRGSLKQRIAMWVATGILMLFTLLLLFVLYPMK